MTGPCEKREEGKSQDREERLEVRREKDEGRSFTNIFKGGRGVRIPVTGILVA